MTIASKFFIAIIVLVGSMASASAFAQDYSHSTPGMSGYDPVAYFTDGKALVGRDDLEMNLAGAIWRFRNEGNRAAFAANPEVYLPAFGGYDPIAVARGVATPGHPQIWLVAGERLYLFYSPEARERFSAAPESIASEAEKKWSAVLQTIAP